MSKKSKKTGMKSNKPTKKSKSILKNDKYYAISSLIIFNLLVAVDYFYVDGKKYEILKIENETKDAKENFTVLEKYAQLVMSQYHAANCYDLKGDAVSASSARALIGVYAEDILNLVGERRDSAVDVYDDIEQNVVNYANKFKHFQEAQFAKENNINSEIKLYKYIKCALWVLATILGAIGILRKKS